MDLVINFGDFIGIMLDYAYTFMVAYWRLLGVLIGIPLAFIILSGIVAKVEDVLAWRREKEDLLYDKDTFRHLLGGQSGDIAFEQYRLYNELSPSMRKFIFPRDMYSGESFAGYLERRNKGGYIAENVIKPERAGIFVKGTGWLSGPNRITNHEQSEHKLERYLKGLAKDKSGGVQDVEPQISQEELEEIINKHNTQS